MSGRVQPRVADAPPEAWPHRVALFGIELDAVTMAEAVALLVRWTRESSARCRYVVTPNVDHVVVLQHHARMKEAYADASLVVADGWPIVTASRWLGRRLPERVAGSDLVPYLFDAVARRTNPALHKKGDSPLGNVNTGRENHNREEDSPLSCARLTNPGENVGTTGFSADLDESQDDMSGDDAAWCEATFPLRVYLLGAAPGVAVRAARNIHARWPSVQVVGFESPPLGFEHCAEENSAILARIANANPDLLVVGLGAPKQELWVHTHRDQLRAKVAICAGATIDFLAGEKQRAPSWMRRCRLEWLHRMLSEPKRLARRYLRGAIAFPQLVIREKFGKGSSATTCQTGRETNHECDCNPQSS